jgi:serine/threonine-protein kinase RsbW
MILAENKKLRINSKAENILLVEQMIEDVCKVCKINEDYYGNILIAVTEAVNNAIHHGNKADPTKSIDISFQTSDDGHVSFIVKDEGNGFGYDNLPDPTNPENIEKENGRGVFLMRNLADKISFEDKGSTVILAFKIV